MKIIFMGILLLMSINLYADRSFIQIFRSQSPFPEYNDSIWVNLYTLQSEDSKEKKYLDPIELKPRDRVWRVAYDFGDAKVLHLDKVIYRGEKLKCTFLPLRKKSLNVFAKEMEVQIECN